MVKLRHSKTPKKNQFDLEVIQGRNLQTNFTRFLAQIPLWTADQQESISALEAAQLVLVLLEHWAEDNLSLDQAEDLALFSLGSATKIMIDQGVTTEEIVDLLQIDDDFVAGIRRCYISAVD